MIYEPYVQFGCKIYSASKKYKDTDFREIFRFCSTFYLKIGFYMNFSLENYVFLIFLSYFSRKTRNNKRFLKLGLCNKYKDKAFIELITSYTSVFINNFKDTRRHRINKLS